MINNIISILLRVVHKRLQKYLQNKYSSKIINYGFLDSGKHYLYEDTNRLQIYYLPCTYLFENGELVYEFDKN